MPTSPSNADDPSIDRISSLLAQVLETPLSRQGEVLENLCAENRDCAAALRQGYGSLQQFDLVQVSLPPADREPGVTPAGLPRTLGPFRLLELLGTGGMGAVYRAEDLELKRPVALKLVRNELLASSRTRSRFQREAAALARLDHPGLCTAYRAGATDGQPWIAMRLVLGTTLLQQIEARRRAEAARAATKPHGSSSPGREQVQRTLLQFEKIARALATAHAVGVVHRDLKPANIVLTSHDEPVVIDFGLVHLDDAASNLTNSGDPIGTPGYMSPEQVHSAGAEVAATTDVYALAVTLFETLTLHSPYQAKSREELFQCIVRGKRRRLRQIDKRLPADLELVLEKAMDVDPTRRYASMVEFADDLRRYQAQEPLLAARPSAWYRLQKLARRRPGLLLAGGAVFVTAVIGTVVALQFAWRARARVQEFGMLSAHVSLESALAAEKGLHPPWPHRVAAMERWLQHDIGQLLGQKGEIERTLQNLRERALPWTDADREADRQANLQSAAGVLAEKRVTSLRRAQAIRVGLEPLVEPALPSDLEASADALLEMAWPRVAPDRLLYGEEALGLAMSRLMVERAQGVTCNYVDSLAWALFANGQDAEAQAEAAAAVAEAPDSYKADYVRSQRRLHEAIASAPAVLSAAEKELDELANQRRTFRFTADSDGFLHDSLARLPEQIEAMARDQKTKVEQRLAWAKQIEELSLAHPNARHTWPEVRAAIAAADGEVASALYAGLAIELRDQDVLGLVPIGKNPATKLWEFYELRSAWDGTSDPRQIAIPQHDGEGRITVGDDTGIVFALLPGGTFLMGAQAADPNAPNYDAEAQPHEMPHEVTLAPFFLARHELTQGQWRRLSNGTPEQQVPSGLKAGWASFERYTWANPVEQVSWVMCDTLLTQHGLALPTEAQWEYGCRAGSTTPWACQDDDLPQFANLADATAKVHRPGWACEAWSDSFVHHAPSGTFAANRFGLHDTHGNVAEWCRDEFGEYLGPVRDGDGLRHRGDGSGDRCHRGGDHSYLANHARSARRDGAGPANRHGAIGLRAARALHPID